MVWEGKMRRGGGGAWGREDFIKKGKDPILFSVKRQFIQNGRWCPLVEVIFRYQYVYPPRSPEGGLSVIDGSYTPQTPHTHPHLPIFADLRAPTSPVLPVSTLIESSIHYGERGPALILL